MTTRKPAATELTDEAVQAAAKALETVVKQYPVDPNRKPWEGAPIGATFHELARAALEAALPLIDLGGVHNGQCPGCPCGWNGPHPARVQQDWTDYGTGAGWPPPPKPTT